MRITALFVVKTDPHIVWSNSGWLEIINSGSSVHFVSNPSDVMQTLKSIIWNLSVLASGRLGLIFWAKPRIRMSKSNRQSIMEMVSDV